MSASNEWFEFHLTPNGWVKGSERFDFGLEEKIAPNDRVLTLRFYEYMSSPFSSISKYREKLYHHENNELVNSLVDRFGELPKNYEESEYPER